MFMDSHGPLWTVPLITEIRVAPFCGTRFRWVWKSRWPSWAFRPNEPYGFRRCKAILNRASALVTICPEYASRHPRTWSSTSSSSVISSSHTLSVTVQRPLLVTSCVLCACPCCTQEGVGGVVHSAPGHQAGKVHAFIRFQLALAWRVYSRNVYSANGRLALFIFLHVVPVSFFCVVLHVVCCILLCFGIVFWLGLDLVSGFFPFFLRYSCCM